jgi:hypothetical protein
VTNATTAGNTSANDSTRAVRDTARGSGTRTITGAVKNLFRAAVKALTQRDDEEPQSQPRRRKGETEGEFRKLARKVSRRFDVRQHFKGRAAITSRYLSIPPEAYANATAYLAGTLDMLNQLNDAAGSDLGESFDTPQNHISPHL